MLQDSSTTLARQPSWGWAVIFKGARRLPLAPAAAPGSALSPRGNKHATFSIWSNASLLASSSGLLEDMSAHILVSVDDVIRVLRITAARGYAFVRGVVFRQHSPSLVSAALHAPRIPRRLSARAQRTPLLGTGDFAHSATCCLIASAGYPVQLHHATTVDGYILPVIRIPRPDSHRWAFLVCPCICTAQDMSCFACRVVFLQHGLLDSPAAWVSSGRIVSLAFRAYQAGYDVFLGMHPCGLPRCVV